MSPASQRHLMCNVPSIVTTIGTPRLTSPDRHIEWRPYAASVFSTSLIQYEVPKTIASSSKL
jgi:hypothetical protein